MPPPILWQPTPKQKENANLTNYVEWLSENKQLKFNDYATLWQWSVEQLAEFWQSMWEYFEIISHTPYSKVLSDDPMPNARWFEGSTLNYVEHVFRNRNDVHPAIVYQSETQALQSISWAQLEQEVRQVAIYLKFIGVVPGDRVVAYLPNIPEATVAFLATASLGAVWSSCSPDFGASSVIDRFAQIEPKVLFAATNYSYNGKIHDKSLVVKEIVDKIDTIKSVVLTQSLSQEAATNVVFFDERVKIASYRTIIETPFASSKKEMPYEALPFAHPLYILFSSGTTGIPKAITHCHGGILLEHYKYLTFHNDVKKGERFFWFSTTGWMMWNYVQSSLLVGATMVLYDGSPGYPNMNVLWKMAEKADIQHFGTSAPFILACKKAGLEIKEIVHLPHLRSISSTGSPLPPEGFAYIYETIKKDLWLVSMAGGTDVCTAFIGGNPLLPVYQGEIQCRALGCNMESWSEEGKPLINEVGEMVITQPMPSMPICFWNDPTGEKYYDSYFSHYPAPSKGDGDVTLALSNSFSFGRGLGATWRHGDWLQITERQSLIILGRSDATLNRQGVRIGTSEIYRAMDTVPELKDCVIINLERPDGTDFMPLYVVLNEGILLNDDLKNKINQTLRQTYSPRHVPDAIFVVPDIPYTISGKKMETPIKKILQGKPLAQAVNIGSVRNPEAIDWFGTHKNALIS